MILFREKQLPRMHIRMYSSLLSPVSRSFERRKMRKTRSCVGYTAGFSVHSAQHRSAKYTRRARRIMGICGRQVAKLYREAGNKRANGSSVRREILWRRACKGLGSACGLTSIKPSKSYLSRLATGGLILLFNVCSLSLVFLFFLLLSFLFLFPSLPFFFRGIIFFVARSCFSLLGPLSILFFLLSFPSSFFFCSLLAAYSGRYLVTIPRESRTGWLVGNVT